MSESITKHKLINEKSIKARFVHTQSRIQQSFKQPLKQLSSLLTVVVYIQCLKYPIDTYSQYWFKNDKMVLFNYVDISYYCDQSISALITFIFGILHFIFSVLLIIFQKNIKKSAAFMFAKLSQMVFSSVLFMWVIGTACTTISQFFQKSQSNLLITIFAIISIIVFSSAILTQTLVRFDFIIICVTSGVIRTSNWSGVSMLVYIIINEITSKLVPLSTSIHLITMSLAMGLNIFIFFIKAQHEEQIPFRIQLIAMSANILAIILLACIKLLNVQLGIQLLIVLCLIIGFSIWQIHHFNLTFQLQNVNKYTNSQIIMSYTAKLRKILLNCQQYYFNTVFLGYYEIHQQKCDNEACPISILPNDDNKKQDRFEQLIRKIYNDGCKLSPINPQLQLQYAIFCYELGLKDKSMKLLLELKHDDLPFDKYYKFQRLKSLIHRQISQLPNQQYLDLLSEIKVKNLQDKIIHKFQSAALINLQFWSVLNQDHPDFRKLYQIGISKVTISQQVNQLYQQITQIAHSQRVTNLYIHYLNDIQNDEKLYSQIYENIRNQDDFEKKIIIQDWGNNCNPIMIVSIEQQNFGIITDLNTTCSTILGYQRYDLIGKQIKILFPDFLNTQIQSFINPKYAKNGEEVFYVGYSNGYAIRVSRKMQSYNSIETGLSLIITLQQKFIPNSGFIIFSNQFKLVTLSASSLQLLALQDTILSSNVYYDEIFKPTIKEINDQKTILKFSSFLKLQNNSYFNQQCFNPQHRILKRTFNVFKKDYQHFFSLNYVLLKNNKIPLNKPKQQKQCTYQFCFQIFNLTEQFMYFGGCQNDEKIIQLQHQYSYNKYEDYDKSQIKKYEQGITTLRLHQNYIKVIQQSQTASQHRQNKSITSTNHQLSQKTSTICKNDQQKIFQSRQSYSLFISKNNKKIYIVFGLLSSIVITIAIYLGLYFVAKSRYQDIYHDYQQIIIQNQIIGEIIQSGRMLVLLKYRLQLNTTWMDTFIINCFFQRLQNLQLLIAQYNNDNMFPVAVAVNQIQMLRLDQYILSFISQYSKISNAIIFNGGLNNFTIDDNADFYVQVNSNFTKQSIDNIISDTKQNALNSSTNALYINIATSTAGIIISLILTIFLLNMVRKINMSKVQILSTFLDTTQRDIQNYSQKTQNFLITLHVQQSSQNNQNIQQLHQGKKGSSVMFAKKKKFKQIELEKSRYFILASFFFISSTFYIHSFVYSYQKEQFLTSSVQYINTAANYRELFSFQQGKIDSQLLNYYDPNNSSTPIFDGQLTSEVNTYFLEYQRNYFTQHYHTYGIFDDYHQKFTDIFMKDICTGTIQVQYACESGIMASNGTLLMLTDVTIVNDQIDFSQPLPTQYYYTMETIKQAHSLLLQYLKQVNEQLFQTINSNILQILIIWILVLIVFGMLIQLYAKQVVHKDAQIIKNMLKFFPVSFAKNSQGVKKFIFDVSQQHGGINF